MRNQADATVVMAEKALKDAGDKVPVDIKTKVEGKVKGVKDVLAKEDAGKEEIETATKDLSDTLTQIGQAMYGAQGQQPPTGEPETEEKKEEKGEEKEEKKKKNSDEKVEEGEVVE